MWFLVAHNCGWLCVSLSVQSVKGGSHFLSTYCRYVVYHNAVIVYLAQCVWYRTSALPWPSKRSAIVVDFFIFVLFAVTPMAVGQYRESSCPMVTSSGFWGSHGHAASGDAVCIAPTRLHGQKMGHDGGTLNHHRQFCHQPNRR